MVDGDCNAGVFALEASQDLIVQVRELEEKVECLRKELVVAAELIQQLVSAGGRQ